MAVRLFVGNMPYGATEADLRAHFSGVGEPSQIVIPVDRETGRPRGFAFVEFLDRPVAEEAIKRFNQQPFMGRSLSVSEARPREAGGCGRRRFRPAGGGGGFGGPRPPVAVSVVRGRRAAGSVAPRPGAAWWRGFDRSAAPGLPRAARISVRRRRRAPRAKSGGRARSAAPRVRSRSATPGGWADFTTTRTTRARRSTDFDDPASTAKAEDDDK